MTYGEPLDAPDGVGKFAFEGDEYGYVERSIKNVTEYIPYLNSAYPEPAVRFGVDPSWKPVSTLPTGGKWWRLHLPWEQQPTQSPTLSPTTLDVCETAIIDSMSNRGAMTDAEFEQWQAQCKAALGEVQAAMRGEPQPPTVPDAVREAISYAVSRWHKWALDVYGNGLMEHDELEGIIREVEEVSAWLNQEGGN